MSLKEGQIKFLRGESHHLKPVVLIGQKGLTDNVMNEIIGALEYHELVKIKVAGADRDEKKALFAAVLKKTKAEQVQQIGHTLTMFKAHPKKPKMSLPK